MVSSTPRPHFTPGKDPVPILQEAGWAPGPVWTGGKISSPPGFNPGPSSLQLVAYITHIISVFILHQLYVCVHTAIPDGFTWTKNIPVRNFIPLVNKRVNGNEWCITKFKDMDTF